MLDVVKNLLTLGPVKNWDYWGVAPDAQNPMVGLVWPLSIEVPTLAQRKPQLTYSIEAAFWASDPAQLLQKVNDYTDFLSSVFQINGCQSVFSDSGYFSAELGPIEISAPSTSAGSSVSGRPGGLWVVVSSELTLGVS
jgi:hypothetical protein